MNDEIKLNQEISRAARARAILEDELFNEAFTALEERYLAEWRVTQFKDQDARERLWQATNLLGKVKDHLVNVLNNGKLAQRQIEQLHAQPRRAA
jgi:hypothetical protein